MEEMEITASLRPFRALIALFSILIVYGVSPLSAETRVVPTDREEVLLSFAPVVKKAAPAVVNVFTKKTVKQRGSRLFDDPFFRRFFGDQFFGMPRERMESSLGSGVIVSEDGLVVTNHHVIEGADEVTVILPDRRQFEAEIILRDRQTDLAILKVDPGDVALPTLELKDSDDVEVGDLVLALGNPFGVGQTVTSGIVSAVARTQVGITDFSSFIQTDAAINPGNSGGALVTLDGRLIGINTAIFSKSGGSVGIGFAVPANMVQTVIRSAQAGGKLVRAWPGFTGQTLTSDLAEGFRLDRPGGVIVDSLYPGGPADEAGLRRGDVVLEIDGAPAVSMRTVRFEVASSLPGESLDLAVLRDGKRLDLKLPVQEPPENPPANPIILRGKNPLAGAEVANLSPAFSETIGLEGAWAGVVITRVKRGSIAQRVGFRPKDIVLALDGEAFEENRELANWLAAAEGAPRRWHIKLVRGGKVRNVELDL